MKLKTRFIFLSVLTSGMSCGLLLASVNLFMPDCQHMLEFLAISIMSVLTTSLISNMVAEKAFDPLRRFFDGMKKLSEGESGYRIYIDFNSELGVLAHRFNNMAEKMEITIKERDKLLNTISAALSMKAEFDNKINGIRE